MARKYCNKKIEYVESMEDFNFILDIAASATAIAQMNPSDRTATLRHMSYLVDNQRYIELTTRYVIDIKHKDDTIEYQYDDNHPCTWIFDKTGTNDQVISTGKAVRRFNDVYKPMELVETGEVELSKDGKAVNSASPIIGYNPKYDGTEHMVYCYDLNSAYANVLVDKIIDTEHPHYYSVVGDNQIGFNKTTKLEMIHEGDAEIVFDLIESPFKDICTEWYNIKKTAPKGSRLKKEAKNMLVIPIGNWQNHNPYLRAYVVNTCNERIQAIIDKHKDDICMWNTDAVYSTVPLNDLELGDNIGQFKLEYQGLFRQLGNNYQKVETNDISYRGVCKILFKEGYNLLTDGVPKGKLPFEMDYKEMKVKYNG